MPPITTDLIVIEAKRYLAKKLVGWSVIRLHNVCVCVAAVVVVVVVVVYL